MNTATIDLIRAGKLRKQTVHTAEVTILGDVNRLWTFHDRNLSRLVWRAFSRCFSYEAKITQFADRPGSWEVSKDDVKSWLRKEAERIWQAGDCEQDLSKLEEHAEELIAMYPKERVSCL